MSKAWKLVAAIAIASVFSSSTIAEETKSEKPKRKRPTVQMVIVLDTSSSMAGLVNQARAHLWKITNQFIETELGGQKPRLEVALLEYGAGRLSPEHGYTRLVVPLTDNLDKVSEELNALTTVARPGGSLEHCGQIIDLAVKRLEWSETPRDLKCIFIAGNESFTQGPVDFREACKAAASKGVTVSTIFCGDHSEGVRLQWEEGSKLADGSYLSINHNQVARSIATPQDKEIAALNEKLNGTYQAYGDADKRRNATRRQVSQDRAAGVASRGAVAERARFKSSSLYRNESWDLVDALNAGRVKLEELKDSQLPEPMRKLTLEQRRAYLEKLTKQRAQLQEEIKKLSQKREEFLSEARKQEAPAASATLDAALIKAVEVQAKQKNEEIQKGPKSK